MADMETAGRGIALRGVCTIFGPHPARHVEHVRQGMDKAELFREALRTFIRVQAGKRLAALGGRAPHMPDVPRRRGQWAPPTAT